MKKKEKVLIVGAGLAGSLLAIKMAKRGHQVEVHEKLPDMRKNKIGTGRSINLALSNRGLKALKTVGLEEEVLKNCIGMKGRLIHHVDGITRMSKYSGRAGELINSVSRSGLNSFLLNKAEEFSNVHLHFDSQCQQIDLEQCSARFLNSKKKSTIIKATVILGTDGAGSAVRQSLMAKTTQLLFNFSQNFLRSGYKELELPAAAGGSFRMEKNALHIWPRGKFMMIALPNLDGSFTATMFHPYDGEGGFNTLNSKEKLLAFFEKYYPDTIAYFPNLAKEYFGNPTGILGTIKCYPWQANGKVMVLGDAAHAIVPFYGQGMNAALEDVRIFDETLEKNSGNWATTLQEFQDIRVEDTNAIADLAVDNFHEMQEKVADETFIKKRKIETQLEQTYPDYYAKYSLVTFRDDVPYSEALRRGRKQDELLLNICDQVDIETLSLDKIYRQLQNI